jgi:ATP synthase protein I
MAGDPQSEDPAPPDDGADAGWTAVGYLLGGMIVWGGAGWLVDRWLDLSFPAGLLVGLIGGGAAGVYLIVKRLGA